MTTSDKDLNAKMAADALENADTSPDGRLETQVSTEPSEKIVGETRQEVEQTGAMPSNVIAFPGKPKTSEVSEEMAAFNGYVNKLMAKEAVNKKVSEAKIEEVRNISKEEAVKYMIMSAIAQGIDPENLELMEERVDAKGEVLKLEAKHTDPKTGNYKLISYQIKIADDNVGETNVDIADYDKDSEWPNGADIVATFSHGKWWFFDNSKIKNLGGELFQK